MICARFRQMVEDGLQVSHPDIDIPKSADAFRIRCRYRRVLIAIGLFQHDAGARRVCDGEARRFAPDLRNREAQFIAIEGDGLVYIRHHQYRCA